MRTSSLAVFTVWAAASCSTLSAQAYRGGDLVFGNFRPHELWRIDPTPGATPVQIAGAGQIAGAAGVAARRDGTVLTASFSTNEILAVDPAGNVSSLASVTGPLRVVEDDFGNIFASSGAGVVQIDAAGTVSTVATGAPLVRPFDVAMDSDGSLLVVDDRARGLFRVDTATGAVTTIHLGAPFRLPQGVALTHDGDFIVFDGLTDSLFRVDRASGNVSTFVSNAALGENPCGIVESGDGGFFVSQSSAAISRVVHVDLLGNVTEITSGAPLSNVEDIARIPFLRGPAGIATSGSPSSTFGFSLDAPNWPNTTYTLALSAGVHPGAPLTVFGDNRAFTVNLDALFRATALSNAPPVLLNWSGLTDMSGTAQATLDLSTSPAGGLSGATLHVSALLISPTAPTSFAVITNVHRLRF